MNRFTALLSTILAVAACSSDTNKTADTTAAVTDTTVTASASASTPPSTGTSATDAAIVPININTATDAEILRIPGVGPRMLREFKEYRPYTSIEQFRREIGKYVDKAEVARLEKYIVIK